MIKMDSKYTIVLLSHFSCVFLLIRIFIALLPCFLTSLICNIIILISTLLVGHYTLSFTKKKWLNDFILPEGKAIFITGCDSGFGKELAIRLDSKGYRVFASCLFPTGSGAEELKKTCSDRLQILELDVTKDQSIKDALDFVKENLGTSDLWALVNNAGIHKGFSVELTDIQDFYDCMEVNVFGALKVTKLFLPLLRKSKGRVINLTSLIGRMPLPHFTPYIISKYAVAGFNDCLRQELANWDVSVISIEPDMYRTGLVNEEKIEQYFQSTIDDLDETLRSDYGGEYLKYLGRIAKIFSSIASPELLPVIDDLEIAVSSEYPELIYSPRRNILLIILLYIYKMAPLAMQDVLAKLLSTENFLQLFCQVNDRF